MLILKLLTDLVYYNLVLNYNLYFSKSIIISYYKNIISSNRKAHNGSLNLRTFFINYNLFSKVDN